MKTIINSKWFIWGLLALPALPMTLGYAGGGADAMEMLHPTGEFSVRFMVLAMMIGPLADIFGSRRWIRWLLARRRWMGVAAFAYAVAHLVFYVIDMGALGDILAELGEHGIWTGWAAFVLMGALALTSTDSAMHALARNWKRLQRLAYPAAVLAILHWGLLTWEWAPAAVHFGPLVLLNLVRLAKQRGLPIRKEIAT